MFCLGIAAHDDIIKGVASGAGNAVYYVGAKTGRDGIHGATMASAEFDDKSAEKRPAVQVGDPFMEKLLLEACLEVMKSDALIGIQDMGAAGLTCSTSEMGSRGGAGVEIDVSLVPQRETGMTPYEIMLSESQERMLMVVKRGREAEVERIFEKWDLHAVRVGEVTTDGKLRVKNRGEVVAEIPNRRLTDDAPLYRRPMTPPAYITEAQQLSLASLGKPVTPADAFTRLLASPTIASKRWVYRQYDHMVRTNTLVLPGMGAGVVRVKGTRRALAMSVDCNGRFVYLDPHRRRTAGGRRSGAERRLRRSDMPIGATNCLNFGNPETAGNHVAVRTRGRGNRRRVPRARHSDHRRQRESLQRDRRTGGSADAGARRRRPDRRCRHRRAPRVSSRRRQSSYCSARRATSWAAASI